MREHRFIQAHTAVRTIVVTRAEEIVPTLRTVVAEGNHRLEAKIGLGNPL